MSAKHVFAIGSFTLDVQHRVLWRAGEPVALGPKVIDVLIALVERNGELVTKDELMERVWPNRFVEEGNISQSVHRLRRVLSDGGLPNAIMTMPGRGYRFTGQRNASHVSIRPTFALALAACALVILSLFGLAGTRRATPAFERLSLESQQQYRLALYHLNLRSDLAHIEKSLQDFAAVAHRDPTNPLGFAGLADAYLSFYDAQCDASPRNCQHIVQVARVNALKAVAVDPRSAEAHTALAMTLNEFDNDIAGSEAEFRRAISLDPAYALAHHWYGNLLTVGGRFPEAMVQHKIALRLDPTSPSTYSWLAHDAFFSHNYAAAIRFAQRSDDLYPTRHPMRVLAALSYQRLGETQQALYSLRYLNAIEAQAFRAAVYAGQGRRSRALALLRPITLAQARTAGATTAMAFAWMALRNDVLAYEYMRSTPIPNRVERNFLAYDPRWNVTRDRTRFAVWMTPH
jgi:DNA-binding winged helix-turn-helix (wHTH) protein/Flp pilus assembly protein TadD